MTRVLLALFLVLNVLLGRGQNLVANPSFEQLSSKPKEVGELHKATGWISPTDGTADIFYKGKVEVIGTPENTLGKQTARTGENYAGAIFYNKKSDASREYIQTEFTAPMAAGKTYCVEFYVSAADLAKYGINKIGAYISEKGPRAANWEPLNFKPQITCRDSFMADPYEWKLICGDYRAKGGEKFITIGNFYPNAETKFLKIKKPGDVKGVQNEYGYYYIDDVSVFDADSVKGNCQCEEKLLKSRGKMNYVYSRVEGGEQSQKDDPAEVIEAITVYFENAAVTLSGNSRVYLQTVLGLMKENEALKLQVTGYANEEELKKDPELSKKRAQAISELLIKGGVDASRVSIAQSNPIAITIAKDEQQRALNRRVDFHVAAE